MIGSTTQLFWDMPWNDDTSDRLRDSFEAIGLYAMPLLDQTWDPKTATIGGFRDITLARVASAGPNWSSILLPLNSQYGDALAQNISTNHAGLLLCVAEYDQDAWGYELFRGGQSLDRFWNSPEAVDVDAGEYMGNPSLLATAFSVDVNLVSPYVKHIDVSQADDSKAFPDDQFPLWDHWVRVDFLRRLGIIYPENGSWWRVDTA